MNEAKTSQEYVVMFAEHQKNSNAWQLLRRLLAALVSNPNIHKTYPQMIEEALGCADLLLEEALKGHGSHSL